MLGDQTPCGAKSPDQHTKIVIAGGTVQVCTGGLSGYDVVQNTLLTVPNDDDAHSARAGVIARKNGVGGVIGKADSSLDERTR